MRAITILIRQKCKLSKAKQVSVYVEAFTCAVPTSFSSLGKGRERGEEVKQSPSSAIAAMYVG